MSRAVRWLAVAAAVTVVGCTSVAADHEYVTDYRVVGDKTVKYIYLPGENSRAGGRYLDEAVALEICSVEPDRADEEDGDDEGEADEDEPRGEAIIETDCEKTRLLKTEEYR